MKAEQERKRRKCYEGNIMKAELERKTNESISPMDGLKCSSDRFSQWTMSGIYDYAPGWLP